MCNEIFKMLDQISIRYEKCTDASKTSPTWGRQWGKERIHTEGDINESINWIWHQGSQLSAEEEYFYFK